MIKALAKKLPLTSSHPQRGNSPAPALHTGLILDFCKQMLGSRLGRAGRSRQGRAGSGLERHPETMQQPGFLSRFSDLRYFLPAEEKEKKRRQTQKRRFTRLPQPSHAVSCSAGLPAHRHWEALY